MARLRACSKTTLLNPKAFGLDLMIFLLKDLSSITIGVLSIILFYGNSLCFIHIFLLFLNFIICSVFKDEKEPKNLFLKEDFALHRSPKGWINQGIYKVTIAPSSLFFSYSLWPKSAFRTPFTWNYIDYDIIGRLYWKLENWKQYQI